MINLDSLRNVAQEAGSIVLDGITVVLGAPLRVREWWIERH